MADSETIIRVTVEDLAAGTSETFEVPAGEYVILCTEPCHVSSQQVWGGGKTVQLTIKDRVPR